MIDQSKIKGTLIPIGGGEDKGADSKNHPEFLNKGILSHVLKESGGATSKVVIIPTASRIPQEVGKSYVDAFSLMGCSNVEVLDIRKKAQSSDPSILKTVEEADCVLFSGGNQALISTKIGRTPLHTMIAEKLANQDFVIAGTSAGAMAMATNMIAGGSASEALLKGAVHMRPGLGLIPELILDTHFVRRGRFGRLAEAVAAFPHTLGIGLAEDTGLIIKHNQFTVIGSGMVVVMDPSALSHNSHGLLKKGTPMTLGNLTVHILANGDHFTLDNKVVEVLKMDKSFV